jgi:uncharacterized protein YdhG (YjbR/CyaY superfamily)
MPMRKAKDVDQLIGSAPEAIRGKLIELRKLIRETVPEAKESISYGMAFYDYKGRLVYFGPQKNHIGLYIPPPIIGNHKKELENYGTTKSAVHLSLDEELPASLIKKLVAARVKWNNKSKN